MNFSEAWEVNASRVLRRTGVPRTVVRVEIAIAVRTRVNFISGVPVGLEGRWVSSVQISPFLIDSSN